MHDNHTFPAVHPAAGPGPVLRGSIDGQTGNTAAPSGQVAAQHSVILGNLPRFVLTHGRFCVWRFEARPNSNKPAKVPYNPVTLQRADSSNPNTFVPIDAVRDYQSRGFNGIGLFIGNGISAIDIDHCITEQNCLTPLAQDVLNTMNGAYMEYSPSRRGIRILFYTPPDFTYDKNKYLINNQKLGLEIYISQATSKYVSVTGWKFSRNADLMNGSAQLMQVAERYMLRNTPTPPASSAAPNVQAMLTGSADKAVLDAVMRSGGGQEFQALMSGDLTSCNGDHSAADMKFCSYLAAYTDDAEQMDRIMRKSGLMRDKWDRPTAGSTYGRDTITKAISTAQQYRANRAPRVPPETMQALRRNAVQQQPVQQQPVQQQLVQQQAVQQQLVQQQAQGKAPEDDDDTISARELQATPMKPVEYIVEDILPTGLTLLVGPSKIRKSWMSLDLSLSVAAGMPFLGRKTQKGGVLYLALEDSKSRIKGRMELILRGRLAPDNFYFRTHALALDAGLPGVLKKHIEKHPDIKLLIIDTFQKVRGVARHGESTYAFDYREVSLLKGLADEYGIALILVHHTRKMVDDSDPYKMISGTNGIMGSSDTAWVLLKSKRSDDTACLNVTGRDVREAELVIRFEDSMYRWVQVGTQEEVQMRAERQTVDSSPIVQTILALLKESTSGTWSGTSTKLLEAGTAKGHMLAQNGMELSNNLRDLIPLMDKYAGVKYSNRSNGNAGRIHCFTLDQHSSDETDDSVGVQGEQTENDNNKD